MDIAFAIIAFVIIASALAAMTLRNLVHCTLCLTVTFVGLAVMFLKLGAEFVGFAQILVYVGAVAILVLFAILLTRGGDQGEFALNWSPGWWVGVAVAVVAAFCLWLAIRSSGGLPVQAGPLPDTGVKLIGQQLLDRPDGKPENYILPLLVTGALLTVAMIGAVIIAMQDRREEKE